MRRAGDTHSFLFTSREYHEVTGLAKVRGLYPTYVGRFGGGSLASKLDASLERAHLLTDMVQEFTPDVTVTFQSPEAARISFGLAIPHICFCNSPHAKAACRLTIPLSSRVLISNHIPKSAVSIYGIDPTDIVHYMALDEMAIIQNAQVPWDPESVGIIPGRKTILFRVHETKASYVMSDIDIDQMISYLYKSFPECNIVISGRYPDQIRRLYHMHKDRCIILDGPIDSGALLGCCDVFVGSGGTMTTEAVLRGVPSVSYCAVASIVESYLVDSGALFRANTPQEVVQETGRLLDADPAIFSDMASEMESEMEDPYDTLQNQMDMIIR